MNNEVKTTEQEAINAIHYIKSSSIFDNPRYEWIFPLITKTLEDDLSNTDIDDLVDFLLSKKKAKSEQTQPSQLESEVEADHEDEDVDIKKIKSIDKISNIGLLDVGEPIVLKDGLNIFYGKNGAGKSSIYRGLCKVLGKNQRVCSNIATESDESCCEITFEGNDGVEYSVEWDSDDENEESKVMIFDSMISNYIVDQDQENQFKMAHLKMEYFSFLYDLCQKVEDKLNQELDTIEVEYNGIEQVLTEKSPFVFEKGFDWEEKKIKQFNFTEKDKNELEKINTQIKVLEKDNPEAVVKNMENALGEAEGVLEVFGERDEDDDWELYYDKQYFEKVVNDQIAKYNEVKKAFEKSGKNKISSLIPPEWIDSDTWEDFISSSIDFLNSLDEEEAQEYAEEKCAYCHQPLKTKEAKVLVKAYQELHDEHKEKLEEGFNELKEMSKLMDECIKIVDEISLKNKKIEAEFGSIGRKGKITFDFENIKTIFQKYKTSITKEKKIVIDDKDIKEIESFWNIYKKIIDELTIKIDKLTKDIANKDAKIEKFKTQTKPLFKKKSIYENKNNILKYLKLHGLKEILVKKISDITPLRHSISSLKSSFAKKATLKEFKKCLKSEYKCFGFSPPETWSISPSTRNDVNKRVYSIGDKRLADIFSEGERKLHALSDFFAHCELDKYKGVYIFDDPVNSLDEGNIEAVAKRIKALVEAGNQVIVFTHNLVFLNSIIDTQKDSCTLIECLDNQIIIEENIKIGDKKELSNRLKEIDKRMKAFESVEQKDISEYDFRNVYDLISGYLENYLAVVMLSDIVGRYRSNIRMNSLDKLKGLDNDLLDKMIELYKQSSLKGSRHGMPTSAEVEKPTYLELIFHVNELKDNFKLS